MSAKVVIPCMVPFSGDRLRTPTGRHRWKDEVYATVTHPSLATLVVRDNKCVFCGNWWGDVIERRKDGRNF